MAVSIGPAQTGNRGMLARAGGDAVRRELSAVGSGMTRRSALALIGAGALALVGCGGVPDDDAAIAAGVSGVAATAPLTGRGAGTVIVSDAAAQHGATGATGPVASAFAAGAVGSVRVIGDSITAGYGCDGYGEQGDAIIYDGAEGTFVESGHDFACWANDFRAFAEGAGVAADAFVNAGISGARMAWLADEPDAWLADADLIVVMLGTNDAAWSTLAEYEANARTALAAAAGRCTQLVVVSPPNNWRDDGRARFTMAEADEALSRVCGDAGYVHVSALDAVAMDDGTMNADGIHPTTAGSHAIWKAIAAQLGLQGR